MYINDYIIGDTAAICDVCGFKYKGSQLKKRWDGAMVCRKDFELRHPQDSLKPRSERQFVKDARPEPTIHYVTANENRDKL